MAAARRRRGRQARRRSSRSRGQERGASAARRRSSRWCSTRPKSPRSPRNPRPRSPRPKSLRPRSPRPRPRKPRRPPRRNPGNQRRNPGNKREPRSRTRSAPPDLASGCRKANAAAQKCSGFLGKITIQVSISSSSGRVSTAKAQGSLAGTSAAKCVARAVQTGEVPEVQVADLRGEDVHVPQGLVS